VVVQGIITKKSVYHASKGGNSYYISYAFTTNENHASRISDTMRVTYWFYSSVDQGGPLAILYVRGEPEIHRVQKLYTLGDFSPLPGLVGGGVILVALFFIWMLIREFDRAWRLDRAGVVGQAWIMDLLVETSDKGRLTYYVVYEVPQAFVVRHTIGRDRYDQLKVGLTVPVRYVPDDPRIFRPEW
jgi:hypothetical protein